MGPLSGRTQLAASSLPPRTGLLARPLALESPWLGIRSAAPALTPTSCVCVIPSASPSLSYNVKRRCAGLASIPQSLFDSQLAALTSKKAAESAAKATLNCKACKKTFGTASAYQAHISSKKHLKKAEKGEAEDGDAEPEEKDVAAASAAAAAGTSASAVAAAAASLKAESKHDDDADDSMESGEESEEGEAIPLLHCLFCTKEFNSVAASVDHMLKQHGFFIPFVENLVDLEGLLTYLGEKVGIGHVCLWYVQSAAGGCDSAFGFVLGSFSRLSRRFHSLRTAFCV